MAVIPVVHQKTEIRAAIRRGLPRPGPRLVTCPSPRRVHRLLDRELVDAIVIDVKAGLAPDAFRLAAAYPRIPVFAFAAFRPDDGRLLSACTGNGIREIFVDGVDDPVAGELINGLSAGSACRALLTAAPRRLRLTEPVQLRAWEVVLAGVGTPLTTAGVARTLGLTREHLSREFAAGGAANLKRVIDLSRLAWAADLLANPGYSVACVARVLHYSSASHLSVVARRITGVTARELRRLGPRGVLDAIVRGRTRSRV